MPQRLQVEFPDGRKLLFGKAPDDQGLQEVSVSQTVVTQGAAALEKGLSTLGDLCGMLDAAVSKMPKAPKKIEMEFRAQLSGEADLWVVSGDAEAEFTVKLSWENG
jgi:hypothetical protein